MSKTSNASEQLVKAWEKMGISPTGVGNVPGLLDILWEMVPRMTLCLIGETGVGKTPIVTQWAHNRGFGCMPLNFGHMNQEDVSMIMLSEQADHFDFVPPKFLLDLNAMAEAKGGAVLFLDEWNRGDKALVNALFTLTDERRIHGYKLHPNVLVVAAMNPSDGTYLVNEAEKDHAIRKRLNMVYVTADISQWMRWAASSGIDNDIRGFLSAMPNHFYDAGARDAGKTFPCPSNWEKVSRVLQAAKRLGKDIKAPDVQTLVEGQVGTVTAGQFLQYLEDATLIIKPQDVLFKYTDKKSDVRKRVAKALNAKVVREELVFNEDGGARLDVINPLSENIALVLFAEKPDPAVVGLNLAQYFCDLPMDAAVAFARTHIFAQQQSENVEDKKYMNRLSGAMQKLPAYPTRMHDIMKALRPEKT